MEQLPQVRDIQGHVQRRCRAHVDEHRCRGVALLMDRRRQEWVKENRAGRHPTANGINTCSSRRLVSGIHLVRQSDGSEKMHSLSWYHVRRADDGLSAWRSGSWICSGQ